MNNTREGLLKTLATSIKEGNAVAYSISQINQYEVHCWEIDKGKMYKIHGHFPHHNPKIGNHATVEEITEEELQAIKDNTFDRAAFDARIIERHKKYWPYLWK